MHYVADPTGKGGLEAGESGRKKGIGERVLREFLNEQPE